MSANPRIALLLAEIEKSRAVLARIDAFYREQDARPGPFPSRSTEQAIVQADILVSFYTCLETVFLRIAQHFENQLGHEKWHRELLHRMSLEVPGIRERALSDETAALLGELLRFRHFKRYYFDFQYDWDRIDFLRKVYERLRPMLSADLDHFVAFLRSVDDT